MTALPARDLAAPTNPDFDYIRELVRRGSAIVLEPSKEYLVEARLVPLARSEGLTSIAELVARLRAEGEGDLYRKVVEAMTTNETLFFRDLHPFDALRTTVLPELEGRRAAERRLRIWSAACSTGQEPYTIAMLLRENFATLARWRIEILATDLSSVVLAKARDGRFGPIEVNRGLPLELRSKFFTQSGLDWKIKDEIRRMVDFQELNLAAPWPPLEPFDVVLLRNVLIYFDSETKKSILGRVRRVLRPDGYLFLGAAETTMNLDDGFERVQIGNAGGYRVKPGRGAPD